MYLLIPGYPFVFKTGNKRHLFSPAVSVPGLLPKRRYKLTIHKNPP